VDVYPNPEVEPTAIEVTTPPDMVAVALALAVVPYPTGLPIVTAGADE
jgi:hypothetical protein